MKRILFIIVVLLSGCVEKSNISLDHVLSVIQSEDYEGVGEYVYEPTTSDSFTFTTSEEENDMFASPNDEVVKAIEEFKTELMTVLDETEYISIDIDKSKTPINDLFLNFKYSEDGNEVVVQFFRDGYLSISGYGENAMYQFDEDTVLKIVDLYDDYTDKVQ